MSTFDNMSVLPAVKLALRITEDTLEPQLIDLIDAAVNDLGIAGVNGEKALVCDALIRQAVITYCKMNLSESSDYDRLKKSYDEQKAQLSMATGYTVWEVGADA